MMTEGSTTSGAEKSRGEDEGKDPTEGGIIKGGENKSARTPLNPENPEGHHQHESSRSDIIRREDTAP